MCSLHERSEVGELVGDQGKGCTDPNADECLVMAFVILGEYRDQAGGPRR